MGVFQLLYLDRVPDRTSVDESVKLARKFGHPGTAGLVNAVMRKIAAEREKLPEPVIGDDPAPALASIHSHPEWMVRRWVQRYGVDEAVALLEANNQPPPVTIRVNRAKVEARDVLHRLEAAGLKAERGTFHPGTIRIFGDFVPAEDPGFAGGEFVVQDESESLVVDLLNPAAGDTVIDLCAAPGGKTTQIAERVGKLGRVIAVEVQRGRLKPIAENRTRLGLDNVSIVLADGASLGLLKPVDRVLVDAPCSGLGVLAKRADARWRKTEAKIRAVVGHQERLIRAGARLVKPGGVLVYSVCSIEPDEGRRVVERFLREAPQFVMEDASEFIPAGVTDGGALTTLPHRHHMDGAYAARLKRKNQDG